MPHHPYVYLPIHAHVWAQDASPALGAAFDAVRTQASKIKEVSFDCMGRRPQRDKHMDKATEWIQGAHE